MRTKSANDIKRQLERITLATFHRPYINECEERRIFDRLFNACKIHDRYIRNMKQHLAPASRIDHFHVDGWFKPAVWERNLDTKVSTQIYAAN